MRGVLLHISCGMISHMRHQQGLTFIEILLVIAVLGILLTLVLATVTSSRQKAVDNRTRSNIGQIRLLAEIAFDSNGGTYFEWSKESSIQTDLTRLLEKIDEDAGDAAGPPYVTLVRESQKQNYCVSAPLKAGSGNFYCVDSTGKFRTTSSACPDFGDETSGDPPLRCPGN